MLALTLSQTPTRTVTRNMTSHTGFQVDASIMLLIVPCVIIVCCVFPLCIYGFIQHWRVKLRSPFSHGAQSNAEIRMADDLL